LFILNDLQPLPEEVGFNWIQLVCPPSTVSGLDFSR